MTNSRDGEEFLSHVTGQRLVEIFAEAGDKVFAFIFDTHLCFERGADGKVDRLMIIQGGRKTPARKNKQSLRAN